MDWIVRKELFQSPVAPRVRCERGYHSDSDSHLRQNSPPKCGHEGLQTLRDQLRVIQEKIVERESTSLSPSAMLAGGYLVDLKRTYEAAIRVKSLQRRSRTKSLSRNQQTMSAPRVLKDSDWTRITNKENELLIALSNLR